MAYSCFKGFRDAWLQIQLCGSSFHHSFEPGGPSAAGQASLHEGQSLEPPHAIPGPQKSPQNLAIKILITVVVTHPILLTVPSRSRKITRWSTRNPQTLTITKKSQKILITVVVLHRFTLFTRSYGRCRLVGPQQSLILDPQKKALRRLTLTLSWLKLKCHNRSHYDHTQNS